MNVENISLQHLNLIVPRSIEAISIQNDSLYFGRNSEDYRRFIENKRAEVEFTRSKYKTNFSPEKKFGIPHDAAILIEGGMSNVARLNGLKNDDGEYIDDNNNHVWRMQSELVTFMNGCPTLFSRLDSNRIQAAIYIHDIGEIIVGDQPTFSKDYQSTREVRKKKEFERGMAILSVIPEESIRRSTQRLYEKLLPSEQTEKELLVFEILDKSDGNQKAAEEKVYSKNSNMSHNGRTIDTQTLERYEKHTHNSIVRLDSYVDTLMSQLNPQEKEELFIYYYKRMQVHKVDGYYYYADSSLQRLANIYGLNKLHSELKA